MDEQEIRAVMALWQQATTAGTDIDTWAYCWSKLHVTVTPRAGGPSIIRAGDTLSILRKHADGAWQISRDANLLASVA